MKTIRQVHNSVKERVRLAFGQKSLGQLIDSLRSISELSLRINWICDFVAWLSVESNQSDRLEHFIAKLQADEVLKKAFAKNICLVLDHCDPLELFCDIGMSEAHGFFKEFFDRLFVKKLPRHKDLSSLAPLFEGAFKNYKDADWVERIEQDSLQKLLKLIFSGNVIPDSIRARFAKSKARALRILSVRVSALSMSKEFRKRVGSYDTCFDRLFEECTASSLNSNNLLDSVLSVRTTITRVQRSLDDSGVSIELVFLLERMLAIISRIELLSLDFDIVEEPVVVTHFIASLIRSNEEAEGVLSFLNSNLSLISKKIVERAGVTGEHYIARNAKDSKVLFWSSAGGGALTAFTALVKMGITKIKMAMFFEGVAIWINYTMSFVVLQFLHLTLATKTPAMTAAVLASKLRSVKDDSSLKSFIDESVHLIRSSFLAVMGNVIFVSLASFVLNFAVTKVFGRPILDEETSLKYLHEHHLFLSLTLWYAVYTGSVLWLASALGGWFENWFVFRGLHRSIAENRQLAILFGKHSAVRISTWARANVMGLGINVALGFLLAFSSILGRFFGLPLDTRHVTLASGIVTISVTSLVDKQSHLSEILFAVPTLFLIGLCNFGVSFFISIAVAAKARGVELKKYPHLFVLLAKRFRSNPMSFFWLKTTKQLVLVLALLTSIDCYSDSWDEVLKKVNLTKEKIHFDSLNLSMFVGTEFQPTFLKPLREDPLRIPEYAKLFREIIFDNLNKPLDLTMFAGARVGIVSNRQLAYDKITISDERFKKADSLFLELRDLHKIANAPLSGAQSTRLKAEIEKLPRDLRAMIAFYILKITKSYEWRQKALSRLPVGRFFDDVFVERIAPPSSEEDDKPISENIKKLFSQVDFRELNAGALESINAVQKLKEGLDKFNRSSKFRFAWSTPLGEIIIDGEEKNSRYLANIPYLLILDFDGDDTYLGGGGSFDFKHPISVIIDMKGNDRYLADEKLSETNPIGSDRRRVKKITPGFGSGLFGYGIVLDIEGNDTYKSYRSAQGRGDFGMGFLWDISGNDQYQCWVGCQGSGDFGIGILLDRAGEDHYEIMQQGQGFGGPNGVGFLIDTGKESDSYLANNTQIDFPALVDPKFNSSFVQGMALGWRADMTDGHSVAGGVGALVDEGGDNKFSAGFFAQGFGYWYGVGILSVGNGNDKYEAGKYAQGASTHFAVGILHETGGNDSYHVKQELGIGEGHDYGVGFFLDDSGNDRYEGPPLSLGCGSAQGMGFFWDVKGDDKYIAPDGRTLGCASMRVAVPSFREYNFTLGIFLDTGGKNEFETPVLDVKGVTKSGIWVNPGEVGNPRSLSKMLGAGIVKSEYN